MSVSYNTLTYKYQAHASIKEARKNNNRRKVSGEKDEQVKKGGIMIIRPYCPFRIKYSINLENQ